MTDTQRSLAMFFAPRATFTQAPTKATSEFQKRAMEFAMLTDAEIKSLPFGTYAMAGTMPHAPTVWGNPTRTGK